MGNYEFVVEIKAGSNSAQVSSAIQTLIKNRTQSRALLIPLVVVPFMGDVGRSSAKAAVFHGLIYRGMRISLL